MPGGLSPSPGGRCERRYTWNVNFPAPASGASDTRQQRGVRTPAPHASFESCECEKGLLLYTLKSEVIPYEATDYHRIVHQ